MQVLNEERKRRRLTGENMLLMFQLCHPCAFPVFFLCKNYVRKFAESAKRVREVCEAMTTLWHKE